MDNRPQLLRDLRATAGLSLRDMASHLARNAPHLSYTHTALANYENHRRPVPEGLVREYEKIAADRTGAAHLATSELTTLFTTPGRSDVDRRNFLTSAAYSAAAAFLPLELIDEHPHRTTAAQNGMRIGNTDVTAIRTIVDTLTALDERIGGAGSSMATVEAFCKNELATYTNGTFASDQVRKNMYTVAAEAFYLAGWKRHDAGHETLAQTHYTTAYRFAHLADPHAHAAYVKRILCHQAFHLGQGHLVVNLAKQAAHMANGHVDPHTQSLFTITLARAHAAAGNQRATLAAIAKAETQIERPADQYPHWAALWGTPIAQVHNHAGTALRDLGDLAGSEEKSRQALAQWNPATHPRIWSLTAAGIAKAQHAQGHTAEAQDTWRKILPHLDGIESDRITKIRREAETHLSLS